MAPSQTLTVPTTHHGVLMRPSASPNRFQSLRMPFRSSSRNRATQQAGDGHLARENTRQSSGRSRGSKKSAWWKTQLFAGMINDVRRRAPYYWSDWKDAWDYRVVPATVYMYFAKYAALFVGIHLSLLPSSGIMFGIFPSRYTPYTRKTICTFQNEAWFMLIRQ